jgi:ATP-binding cassette subfamily B protein
MSSFKNKWSKYKSFLLFKEGMIYLLGVLVTLIGAAILGAMLPQELAKLSKNYNDAVIYQATLISLLYIFLGTYLNRAFYQHLANIYVRKLLQKVRVEAYECWIKQHHLSEKQSEKFTQGEIITRLLSDTEAVKELITSGTLGIIIETFFVASGLFSLIQLNLPLGIVSLVLVVLTAVLLILGSKAMRDIFTKVRISIGQVTRTLSNVIGGFRENYFNRHYGYASGKCATVFDHFLDIQLKSNLWDIAYYAVADSLFPLFLLIFSLIFAFHPIGEMAILFAFIDSLQRSVQPIKEISGKIANVQRAATGFEKLYDFHLEFPRRPDNYKVIQKVNAMEVKDVEFFYPINRDFKLGPINLKFMAGEKIGIVGSSGSGKSTLLKILCGDLMPVAGTPVLDLENDRTISLKEDFEDYKVNVGLVSQDSHLFSHSLAYNLSLNNDSNSELEKFWDKAKDDIPYLKIWGIELHSLIIPRDLSQGQKQLLSALRACYLQKPVIFFDEISSALDPHLEKALRIVVELLQKRALTVVVAHRLETILDSHKIIVVANGRIISVGTDVELKKGCPAYQEFITELGRTN